MTASLRGGYPRNGKIRKPAKIQGMGYPENCLTLSIQLQNFLGALRAPVAKSVGARGNFPDFPGKFPGNSFARTVNDMFQTCFGRTLRRFQAINMHMCSRFPTSYTTCFRRFADGCCIVNTVSCICVHGLLENASHLIHPWVSLTRHPFVSSAVTSAPYASVAALSAARLTQVTISVAAV